MATTPRLSDNALTILQARYLLPGESPEQMYRRVARAVAAPEAAAEQEAWAERYYGLMAEGRFLPNSPTLFNAGTGGGTLSACFVIPIEDTMESIMAAATTSAMIQKYGGGIGYSFGALRSRGMPIASTQGKACGAVAVLRMLSSLSDMITQGGKRHGANMGILPVSHPEVMEFIHLKDYQVTAENFNISLAVTDAFMRAVERDADWDLVDPHTSETIRSLPARQVWKEIVASAWATGDPGLYFIDEANRRNPTPHLGRLESTNPCGEVPLLPNEACNLGSINLSLFVTPQGFDLEALDEVVGTAVRFLDNVVTVNEFPVPEVHAAVQATRKIGLGVMGWHDGLMKLRLPYAAPEARALAEKVMERINTAALAASAALAAERGAYPACVGEPVRNATRTCIAPTGSISAIAGCSSGIEPVFALTFVKNVLDGKRLQEVNPHLEEIAREEGVWSKDLSDLVARTGSVQGDHGVPGPLGEVFATAMEIPYEAHVLMQAAFQRHTDLAVSKTINMASSAARGDVEQAYLLAHRERCTGITIYRDGSKQAQVLEAPGAGVASAPPLKTQRTVRDRPQSIRGITERVRTSHGNAYITVNFDEAGTPFEVFATIGKAGSTDGAYLEAISRLISLSLRSGIPPVEIVDQLRGITSEPVWDRGRLVMSAPDAVALVLAMHTHGSTEEEERLRQAFASQAALPMSPASGAERQGGLDEEGLAESAMLPHQLRCPDCNGPVVMQEGCMTCPACGWNRCG